MSRPAFLITHSAGQPCPYTEFVQTHHAEAVYEPMLSPRPAGTALPDLSVYRSLVFTSAHAVKFFAAQTPRRDFQVFTVGDTTAAAAMAQGFEIIHSAAGDAHALQELLKVSDAGRTFYPRGQEIAHVLSGVDDHVVYRAVPGNDFSPAAQTVLVGGQVRAALFFSARGAQTFTRLVDEKGLKSALSGIKALCLSDAVLESLSVLPWQACHVSETPDRAGMLALLKGLVDR